MFVVFSADMNIAGPSKNSILGIGGQVYNDVAGDLDFTTNGAFASLSVMQAFNDEGDHILSGGIQIGKVGTDLTLLPFVPMNRKMAFLRMV